MFKKKLLTVSLLMPLMAISGLAQANHNYQHRPNQPLVLANQAPDSKSCTYQGGPKTGSWACSYGAAHKTLRR